MKISRKYLLGVHYFKEVVIEYRKLKKRARCSCCSEWGEAGKDIYIIVASLKHRKGVHICPKCVELINEYINEEENNE